ncbi:RNA demethylase ALKBH10B-like [Spinacia oleracea]|uniref:RNA demethylase ALKBH10B-like n=1 Tax=Spinacia oleracea TaxID=3562 RepID=A0ABM3QGM5_SPIOL|nr:RNA demethylase ALKBH10B-like [Spinacia oleracea]
MVNVVKGLKLYENLFNDQELFKLNDFVDELPVAGQNGEILASTALVILQDNIRIHLFVFWNQDDATLAMSMTPSTMRVEALGLQFVLWTRNTLKAGQSLLRVTVL